MISSDDHIIEPPDLWAGPVPEWAADRIPQVRREGDIDRWYVEGRPTMSFAAGIQAGKRFEDPSNLRTAARFDEVTSGGFELQQRLLDNESDGILGSVLYPTLGLSLFRAIPDPTLLNLVFSMYNDWLADFCAGSGGRLKGVAMINVDDVDLAVAELTRAKALGLSGSMIPVGVADEKFYGLPMYDPFWAASQDLEMPVSMHLGTVRAGSVGAATGFDTAILSPGIYIRVGDYCKASIADLIFAGVFERFPKLRVGSVEHELGWIPHFLDRLDYTYTQRQGNELFYRYADGAMPSDFFRRNVFCSFQEDGLGIEHRHEIGIDGLMFGSDYPHTESTFPRSREIMDDRLQGVPEDEKRLIVLDNVRKLYHFDLA
jgi:predicted TIM-barrel fold metal-dependent hydrolase